MALTEAEQARLDKYADQFQEMAKNAQNSVIQEKFDFGDTTPSQTFTDLGLKYDKETHQITIPNKFILYGSVQQLSEQELLALGDELNQGMDNFKAQQQAKSQEIKENLENSGLNEQQRKDVDSILAGDVINANEIVAIAQAMTPEQKEAFDAAVKEKENALKEKEAREQAKRNEFAGINSIDDLVMLVVNTLIQGFSDMMSAAYPPLPDKLKAFEGKSVGELVDHIKNDKSPDSARSAWEKSLVGGEHNITQEEASTLIDKALDKVKENKELTETEIDNITARNTMQKLQREVGKMNGPEWLNSIRAGNAQEIQQPAQTTPETPPTGRSATGAQEAPETGTKQLQQAAEKLVIATNLIEEAKKLLPDTKIDVADKNPSRADPVSPSATPNDPKKDKDIDGPG